MDARRRLLVTDLDNTLWDWFGTWHASFSVLLDGLVRESGVERATLVAEIRKLHQQYRTTEYSNLLNDLPSLRALTGKEKPAEDFPELLYAFRSTRKHHLSLYPTVSETLHILKSMDVRIVGYTESLAYWTAWRIRLLGLDGIIDVLYSAPDHDLPAGVSRETLRSATHPSERYDLESTQHEHTPPGVLKPSTRILESILESEHRLPQEAVYIGDSLMKDIAMAKRVGVLAVHAQYGEPTNSANYKLLQEVSHWTDEDVAREMEVDRNRDNFTADFTCHERFSEILQFFLNESQVA